MRTKGETKGVMKRGEVLTEMYTQGFFFFIPLTFVVVYACIQAVHSDMHMFNFQASKSNLLLCLTQTHTLSKLKLLPTD